MLGYNRTGVASILLVGIPVKRRTWTGAATATDAAAVRSVIAVFPRVGL